MPNFPIGLTEQETIVYRNRQRAENYAQTEVFNTKRGVRYSQYEKQLILEHSIPDRELAKRLQRSAKAIQITRGRLKRENLIEN